MSVYVTTNGKTALLAAAITNLPSPLPQSKFFYIFEYGYQIHTYAASSGVFGRMARKGLVSLTIWAIVSGA